MKTIENFLGSTWQNGRKHPGGWQKILFLIKKRVLEHIEFVMMKFDNVSSAFF